MAMAKLIVNPTSSARREIQLPRSVVSIGRDPSNDVVLPDAMVSRRHAVIEYRGSQYYIRDCNSSNGSLVNGDRVSERNLRDGDLVAIGTARLLFREDPELEQADSSAKVVQHPSVPKLQCPSCKADYRKGDLFCKQCGTTLSAGPPPKVVCTSCGTVVPMPAKFCNACGTALLTETGHLEPTRQRPLPEADVLDAVPANDGQIPTTVGPASELAELEVAPPTVPAPPNLPVAGRMLSGTVPAVPPVVQRPRPERPHAPAPAAPRRAPAEPAGAGRRLLAFLLDGVIVSTAMTALLAPAWFAWPRSGQEVTFVPILLSIALVPLSLALAALYYVYGWGVSGGTPGKKWMGLVVEDEDGVSPIGVPRATMRLLGYVLSGALLGIGFAMAAFGGYGLHDRVAGTRVVARRRG